MTTKEKTKKIIDEFQIPVAKFCRKVGISGAAYYRWQNGDLRLSEETEARIREYINKLAQIF